MIRARGPGHGATAAQDPHHGAGLAGVRGWAPPQRPRPPPPSPAQPLHGRFPRRANAAAPIPGARQRGGAQQQPSWVNEFLDFSAAKRGAHRRTVSDSVAFLDDGNAGVGAHQFDRLDDDQLMSMFSDELAPQRQAAPAASASSPSDHNSVNDEKQDKGDAEEAQSDCNGDGAAPGQPSSPATADPKRVKR